ncbi:MAG: glutamate racemase [Peptostreptococcaceae bacterium]|nr:glutamate racemase [Peptostreptococcaceae bacterium]
MNKREKAIGVFDSGLGGLTVLKEISKVLPNEEIVYFGDTARVPYGPRSSETVTKYTFQSINFLLENNIKAIVIACNTASARSLKAAQERYNIPIIGVIKPGAKGSLKVTKNKRIGIIGTAGTVSSGAYEKEIMKRDSESKVFSKGCPLFVPIVEEGWSDSIVAELTAREYLSFFDGKGIDTLIMGCTHYPMLHDTIFKVTEGKITLVNPAVETALRLKELLEQKDLLNEKASAGSYKFFVSDLPERFQAIGEDFLNKPFENVSVVEIQKY